MDTKISKINMNKVIVLIGAFTVLVVLTTVINTFIKRDVSNDIANNKNEYASSNKIDVIEETSKTNEVIVYETSKEDVKVNTNTQVIPEVVKESSNIDTQAVVYFETAEEEIVQLVEEDNQNISEKVKEKFVELVDFIFYGTEINGITFDELTEETKQKLINIVNRLDAKIEEKVPGYKETISMGAKESFGFLISKLKQGISYLDTKAEEKIGTEKYEEIKENVAETTEKIKDGGSVVIEKGKEVFQTAKDKIKNWYEGWK